MEKVEGDVLTPLGISARGLVIHTELSRLLTCPLPKWLSSLPSQCLINWIHLWALYLMISIGMESRDVGVKVLPLSEN